MKVEPASEIHEKHWANRSRQMRLALILLVLIFIILGVVTVLTRAQSPNCVDLKRRVDDATRAYQTVLTQSQTIDRKFATYELTIRKLQDELIVNDKRKVGAERDIAEAQRDRARCERDRGLLAKDACANVTHRTDTAEKRLAYARANENRLEAGLSENQQRLATTKATLRAVSANLRSAQQDLDEANKAYAAHGCVN